MTEIIERQVPVDMETDQPLIIPNLLVGKINPRGRNFPEIRREAEHGWLPRVPTFDCPTPHEIDDGVIVKPLPRHKETYQVRVCIADTSPLFLDRRVLERVRERREARYWLDEEGKKRYEPMLPQDLVWEHQLREGKDRDAMVVSFFVGEDVPPVDTEVSFETVRVTRNADYSQYQASAGPDKMYYSHARAAHFIRRHLRYNGGGRIGRIANGESGHEAGATSIAAFMIAASHLVGQVVADEGRAGVFKTYQKTKPGEEPRRVLYSLEPGNHEGLGLDPFCPVTSPLRRLGDFAMLYDLHQRSLGVSQTQEDVAELAAVVDRMNDTLENVA